jgi:hypothetical protein
MSVDISPLTRLAVELGEDVVVAMAKAYVESVMCRRAPLETPPLRAQPSPTCTELIEDRMASATPENLAPLIVAIEVAQVSNGISPSLLIDAISRLDALRAVNELNG